MKSRKISGTVTFQRLGTGFWGIIDDQGNEWRPVNLPEQLKMEGKKVTLTVKETDDLSVFMWGTAVEVTGFNT